jgi:hypothetical protein
MSKTTIPKGGITADAIDATLIADDAISEEHIDATVITGSTELAAEPADTDEFLVSDAGVIKRIDYSHIKGGGIFESQLLHVREEGANNTSGGQFSADSFVKRTLDTTKTNEITGASLSSSQITLPAGTYYIFATANVGTTVGRHTAKLRNVTDSSDTIIGSSETSLSNDHSNKSFVIGRFTISGQKVFELQHICNSTSNVDGFGTNANFSIVQVFAEVQIWKTA